MVVQGSNSTVDMLGCTFSGNSAFEGGDIYLINDSTVIIDGCPAGFSGAAVAALDTAIHEIVGAITGDVGTITGEAKSYSCGACVR